MAPRLTVALAGEVMLGRVDDARAHVEQALDAFGQILRAEEQTVTVDGTAHELRGLAKRLRALRDDVAAEDDRAE